MQKWLPLNLSILKTKQRALLAFQTLSFLIAQKHSESL